MSQFSTSDVPLLDFRGEGVKFSFPVQEASSKGYYNFSHEPSAVKISFFGVSLYAGTLASVTLLPCGLSILLTVALLGLDIKSSPKTLTYSRK